MPAALGCCKYAFFLEDRDDTVKYCVCGIKVGGCTYLISENLAGGTADHENRPSLSLTLSRISVTACLACDLISSKSIVCTYLNHSVGYYLMLLSLSVREKDWLYSVPGEERYI